MKKVYVVLIGFFSLVLIAGIVIYYTNFNCYKRGDNDEFACKIGETFKVRLRENGSTGCINCWLNENQCKLVKKIDRSYEPSINARLGYEGAGGIITFTFEAAAAGHDTIKFANCFIGGDEECEDFTPQNTPYDNAFIIDVRE